MPSIGAKTSYLALLVFAKLTALTAVCFAPAATTWENPRKYKDVKSTVVSNRAPVSINCDPALTCSMMFGTAGSRLHSALIWRIESNQIKYFTYTH